MLKKILVPLDGSVIAEQALPYATDIARSTDASLMLVRTAIAHTLAGVDGRERKAGVIEEAEAYLAETRTALVQRGLVCETRAPYGHPAQAIVELARLDNANLIVMNSHGRTGPSRLLLGSVTESVVANSTVPVLVARAWLPPHRQPFLPEHPTLIVPLDGSALAASALNPALELAEDLEASLILVRAAATDEDPDDVQAYLSTIKARLVSEAPLVDVITLVRCGGAAEAIEGAVHACQASLVIMATHARRPAAIGDR